MALWTDIIEPAELTGYARESLNAYEARKGTLARWLPNREVLSTFVKFVAGSAGLVEEARRSVDEQKAKELAQKLRTGILQRVRQDDRFRYACAEDLP